MAFRFVIKPHNKMVPVRSLLVILEKLLTTYTAGFNHLYDRKSRKISGKPCEAERQYNNTGGNYQEHEGPPIARNISKRSTSKSSGKPIPR